MDTRNGAADHIGLVTIDRNVDHTRWPCVSHPPEIACEEAIRLASKRGFRTLPPQRQVPAREWVDKR
ncbi:MAG TPA: hypothetical protein VLL82_13530 [Mycobacterium sp.]|nr:hypothetical protein [Mycobacterium sp.]